MVVIVNNDQQVKAKGSADFMPQQERVEIITAIECVDEVVLSEDEGLSIAKSLKKVAKEYSNVALFFAKGGDRNADNIPEDEKRICQEFDITIINSVGGAKVQSSSWLLNKAIKDKTP